MQLVSALVLVACAGGLCAAGAGAHDVPLEHGLGSGSSQADRLERIEERLIQLAGRLETLSHTVDTQLAQLDDSLLRVYGEVGGGRLAETLTKLSEAAQTAPPSSPLTAEPDLVSSISQQLRQSEELLQSQLNDTQRRLVTLLEEARPAAAPAAGADGPATTVIVERCSFQDQFQTEDRWRPADCAAVQQRHRRSGVYTIFPPVCGNGGGIRVFCDMDTDGGGWTVLMRRADVPDHQDFSMGWQSFKWGFGNLSGEFWLGNEYMNLLTSMDQMQLRIELSDWGNASTFATYTPFSVGTEQQKYQLKVGKYSGNAGDAMAYYNNMKFTTKDQDNDKWSKNCAAHYQNAWWHKSCLHSTLTGPYKTGVIKTSWIGVTWKHWKGDKYSLKHAELKIRPVNYMTWCHKLANEGVRE